MTASSAVCLILQETLFGLLKDYNALVREDGTIPPKATTTFMFNQTFEKGSEEDPKCKRCGKFIAEHPNNSSAGNSAPRSLHDMYPVFANTLPSDNSSKSRFSKKYGSERRVCWVCGFRNAEERGVCGASDEVIRDSTFCVSAARILRNKQEAADLGVPFNRRNYLLLCGALGRPNSCHHLFDSDRLAFIKQKNQKWAVLCRDVPALHGREVILPSIPYRKALHARAIRCIVLRQVPTLTETLEARVREMSPSCVMCGKEHDLVDVCGFLYCAGCVGKAPKEDVIASQAAGDDDVEAFEELDALRAPSSDDDEIEDDYK